MADSSDITDLYQKAVDFHLAGKLADARRLYETILKADPNRADALAGLGAICLQQNNMREALRWFDQSLSIDPLQPAALTNRGNVLKNLLRLGDALDSHNRAIALAPDFAQAYCNRGVVLQQLDRTGEALASYDKALSLNPSDARAHTNRGIVLRSLGRPAEALASHGKAIALNPLLVEAYNNRGILLQESGDLSGALSDYDKAISLQPDNASAHCNKGNVLVDLESPDEALLSYEQAIRLRPDYAEAYSHRGNALQECRRLEEALDSYDRALLLKPDWVEAKWNKSLLLLLMGRFEEGWPLYEFRKKLAKDPIGNRAYPGKLWTGAEDIRGKSILVHREQGLGDTIQFCRYARLLENAGAKVLFAPQKPLRELMQGLGGSIELVDADDDFLSLDFHSPLASLPLAFGTRLSTIPAEVPYLFAQRDRVEWWRERIGRKGFRIGICWQGGTGRVDFGRSFPLKHFYRLSKVANVRLINLHKGEGGKQLEDIPGDMRIENTGEEFDTAGRGAFLDTAAVMKCCDLVITSDTAVAHLAGALGVTTWIALKYVPDWRWMLDRADSPWYPTVRLFRQKSLGDWHGVFSEIQTALLKELISR
jgi:tetratricopeptide (TPR) repeat protein